MSLKSEEEYNPYVPQFVDAVSPAERREAYEKRGKAFETEEEFDEALAIWPRCPSCGRRRITRCPVCKTSGDLFPIGDAEFFDHERDSSQELDENPERRRCGKCEGCGRSRRERKMLRDESELPSTLDGEIIPGVPDPRVVLQNDESDVFAYVDDERERRSEWNEADAYDTPPVLICDVCSEAFVPVFLKRCEWCGYEFKDGEEPAEDASADADLEEFLANKERGEELEVNPTKLIVSVVIVAALAFALLIALSV